MLWFLAVFVLGVFAGSFVNYCALRLPYERSLLWPGPRCLACFQSVHWLDCLPLVGYLLRGGRCRACGAAVPLSYPVVALFTGVVFVALFAVLTGELHLPGLGSRRNLNPDVVPVQVITIFAHHAILFCFLLAASLCDLAEMEIPFSLTLTGTFIGLVLAVLLPFPYPLALTDKAAFALPYPALYPWPVWDPNSDMMQRWLPTGSPQLGLVTGLVGAAVGTAMLRIVGFLFRIGRGIEGMGVGDADLMMMAGAFLGWQGVVMAFFVAVAPGLMFALVHLIFRGTQALPFGPSLAVGVVLTVLYWPVLGEYIRPLAFEAYFLMGIGGGAAILLLGIAFMLWLARWLMNDGGPPQPPSGSGNAGS